MPLYRGSRQLILRRKVPVAIGGGGTPQTPVFIGNAFTSSGATPTSTAQGIGSAFASRRVIVFMNGVGGNTVVSATIGGIAATVHFTVTEAGGPNTLSCFSAPVPTGTTADIIATMSAAGNAMFCEVYTCDDSKLVSTTPTTATNTATAASSPLATNFSQTTGGFAIAIMQCDGGASSAAMTSYTNDFSFGVPKVITGHLDPIVSTGTGTMTVTWSGTASMAVGVVQFQ